MKKLIIFIAITLLSEPMIAQAGAGSSVIVPPVVLTAFSTRFPNAHLRGWQQRPEGYIADFRLGGKKLFAYYSADGMWKGTETPIKGSRNLPAAVRKGWKNSDYAAWHVEDIKKIDRPEGPLYALHIDNGSLLDADHHDAFHEEYVLFFNGEGRLLFRTFMPDETPPRFIPSLSRRGAAGDLPDRDENGARLDHL
jgi:hypothetical protein